MTSLLFWRTQSFGSAPLRKCCHGNKKRSTLNLLPSNKFLYLFRKSHQIWLNYLSPSLSYEQENLKGGAEHPGQDRVKLLLLYQILEFGIIQLQVYRITLSPPCLEFKKSFDPLFTTPSSVYLIDAIKVCLKPIFFGTANRKL